MSCWVVDDESNPLNCFLSFLLNKTLLYRRLEDLVAHEDIISIITNLIDNDQLPHLLLYGPPGTGTNENTHHVIGVPWLYYYYS